MEYIERNDTVNDTERHVTYSLLNKEELSLDYYQKSENIPVFRSAMQTIKELRANNISYEDILRISENGDFPMRQNNLPKLPLYMSFNEKYEGDGL